MNYIDNLKYSLGLKNYYAYSANFFVINLFFIYILDFFINLFTYNYLKRESIELLGQSLNLNFLDFYLLNASDLFFYYILFYILLLIFSTILFVYSKLLGSTIEFKNSLKVIYPYGTYYLFISLIFLIASLNITIINSFLFLLFPILLFIFLYSVAKNFSNFSGLTKLPFFLLYLLFGGIITLIIFLI